MELFHGKTLARIIREGALPPARAIPIFAQILSALDAAHGAGIVHRDIKPANVFVIGLAGGADLVKVLDFGVARLDAGAKLTETGTFLGTPRYMAPEQALGRDVDARADLYSVGATLHHALAGKTSIAARDPEAVLRAVVGGEHEPLASACPGIDPALAAIVSRALAGDPAARFASAKEMLDALLATQIESAPDTVVTPSPPSATARAVLAISLIALAVVTVGLGIAWALVLRTKPTSEPARAPSPPASAATLEPAPEPASEADAAGTAVDAAPSATAPSATAAPRPAPRWVLRGTSTAASLDPAWSARVSSQNGAIARCVAQNECDLPSVAEVTYRIHVEDGLVLGINRLRGDGCMRLDRCVSSVLSSTEFPAGIRGRRSLVDVTYSFALVR
jgi:serine/threonine-protein kinase